MNGETFWTLNTYLDSRVCKDCNNICLVFYNRKSMISYLSNNKDYFDYINITRGIAKKDNQLYILKTYDSRFDGLRFKEWRWIW